MLTAAPKQNAMGAASTSGEVLKGVALKMYSRGMLGPGPDYHTGEQSSPTLYASLRSDNVNRVTKDLNIKSRQVLRTPQKTRKGVPDVHGYGLRDAILALERAGYNVKYTGVGYVSGQNPVPGASVANGSVVHLRLTE